MNYIRTFAIMVGALVFGTAAMAVQHPPADGVASFSKDGAMDTYFKGGVWTWLTHTTGPVKYTNTTGMVNVVERGWYANRYRYATALGAALLLHLGVPAFYSHYFKSAINSATSEGIEVFGSGMRTLYTVPLSWLAAKTGTLVSGGFGLGLLTGAALCSAGKVVYDAANS